MLFRGLFQRGDDKNKLTTEKKGYKINLSSTNLMALLDFASQVLYNKKLPTRRLMFVNKSGMQNKNRAKLSIFVLKNLF